MRESGQELQLELHYLQSEYEIQGKTTFVKEGGVGGSENRKTAQKNVKNRNTASKFTKIPKPQLKMWNMQLSRL